MEITQPEQYRPNCGRMRIEKKWQNELIENTENQRDSK